MVTVEVLLGGGLLPQAELADEHEGAAPAVGHGDRRILGEVFPGAVHLTAALGVVEPALGDGEDVPWVRAVEALQLRGRPAELPGELAAAPAVAPREEGVVDGPHRDDPLRAPALSPELRDLFVLRAGAASQCRSGLRRRRRLRARGAACAQDLPGATPTAGEQAAALAMHALPHALPRARVARLRERHRAGAAAAPAPRAGARALAATAAWDIPHELARAAAAAAGLPSHALASEADRRAALAPGARRRRRRGRARKLGRRPRRHATSNKADCCGEQRG
mmetsp:Transcript_32638/g.64729  ORF Transcript_32638/g.64729 Transcript_32638/m.64729 type:complete len:280 (+) Transcript_32638:1132-1971(+)